MSLPDKPSNKSDSSLDEVTNFEQVLKEVEALLQKLRERYVQLQTAKQDKAELQQRQHQLQTELDQVQEQLKALAVNLEGSLESSYQEYFWQVVRFVGLGFVLGQLLHGCIR